MGIELQSAPQGHHRVGGAHGQNNKPGDASQPDGALGFAALMNLMSCQEPESASAQDATGAPHLPFGLDGALTAPDANAALVTLQPADNLLFALPSVPQPPAACTSQVDGQGVSPVGNLVSELGATQPVMDLTAGVSSERPLPLPPGLVQPGSSSVSSVGVPATSLDFDPPSDAVPWPVGTDTAPASLVLPIGQNEFRPRGVRAGTTGMVTPGSLALPDAAGQGRLVPPQADLKQVADLSVSSVTAVPVATQLPALVPSQSEKAPLKVTRSAADQSKLWTGAKQVLDSLEPNGPVSTPITAQTFIPTLNEPQGQAAVLKPAGVFNSQQAALAGQVPQDSNDSATDRSSTAGFGTSALPVPAFALTPQDAGIRLAEPPAKHLSNRYGSGSDGVYGQPMNAISPADTLFQVAPTSAAVASTAVAETVSYWASQGVQNASLQLDGFGDEPVEVRISVTGDMAQVDFRTNQPEVRQAIEGAASQLKDMLSSQGMQLAGMSIGTSGRGGAQDKGPRPPSDFRKVTLMKSEAVETVRTRGANPAVGQSLDLFV